MTDNFGEYADAVQGATVNVGISLGFVGTQPPNYPIIPFISGAPAPRKRCCRCSSSAARLTRTERRRLVRSKRIVSNIPQMPLGERPAAPELTRFLRSPCRLETG
jgi:hypothetical protein